MTSKAHRLRRGLALATVIGALAAPAASATPIDDEVPGTAASQANGQPNGGGGDLGRPVDSTLPHGVRYSSTQVDSSSDPAPEPVAVAGDGFDWGDAGIGAAGMFALGAIAAGAAVAVAHRPRREKAA
jgi:hypothetical protein